MAGFSYAQAAKGRAAVPATALPPKQEQDKDQPTADTSAPIESKPSTDSAPQAENDRIEPEETTKADDNTVSSKATTVESQSVSAESDPAPSTLAESAATLIKEDEVAANANDSESTTWEKVSQGSQPAEKDTVKSSVASDDSKASDSWEHVQAPPPALKEAPLPTVNPWLKRAQDAQSKVKTNRPISTSLPSSPSPNIAGDSRKKGRQPLAETNGANTAEKSSKHDEASVRRYKPSSETRFSSRVPPPTSDATSWPKPEFAKPDEKDTKPKSASQDRSEIDDSEKDKATGTKKPKTHWEPIPFTPSAVFATPLPTSRRGGRGGARGARETGTGRGAATTNDRASDRDGRTPSSEASVERMSRSETTTRPNNGQLRQKRMSNAGQHKPRDFKKTDEAVSSDDIRINGIDTLAGETPTNGQSNIPATNAESAAGSNASFGQVPNGFDSAEIPQSQDGRVPRSFRENRGEFAGQGRDFGRDGNGMPREGGASRGGRGGRGRGRGGHNMPYYGSHASSNSSFVSNGGFNGPMTHGNERQAPYQFGPGRGENRHYRSGSRSQGGGPASSNRFNNFQGAPQFAPMQMHDMPNGYGFPPAMPQPFYHPAMDQAPILGVLSEQIRYYFSLENLLRDTYLRSRMDDQGFIPLDFMLPWKRMTMITTDANLVRYACQNIAEIELRLDVNGVDYIRPAVDWQHWVMKREDRLPDARNSGPNLQPTGQFAHQFTQPHMFPGQLPPMFHQQQGPPHRHSSGRAINGSPPRVNKLAAQAHMNGHADGSPTSTPLSAEVPEFQPDPSLSSSNILTGNSQDTFSDAQMQHLSVVTAASGSSDKALANGVNGHSASASEHATPESASGPIVASADAE